eukprot:Amastigsp_a841539_23.p3 type:complete len:126 gc:universal Amastigsp_a841539_23:955-578(-)
MAIEFCLAECWAMSCWAWVERGSTAPWSWVTTLAILLTCATTSFMAAENESSWLETGPRTAESWLMSPVIDGCSAAIVSKACVPSENDAEVAERFSSSAVEMTAARSSVRTGNRSRRQLWTWRNR